MTNPVSWLSPAVIHTLGWALIHFVWQGAAIAALAALLMRLCRTPGARYAMGVGALGSMLAMPLITLLFFDGPPALPISGLVSLPSLPPAILPWAVEFWFAGVLLLSLRFAGGFLLLEKRRRGQSRPAGARILALCRDVQQRLGLTRTIRYLECGWLNVPAVIGAFRPVVLVPIAALIGLNEAQLRAVIAHELAHVRRWDFLVNLFQILAETLLFYHPAIWWLNRRIRAEREMCCDDVAVSQIGNRIAYADALVEYARALALMEEWERAPGPAMAANHGILSERIFHILGLPGERPRIAGLAGSLVLLTASLAMAFVLVLPSVPNSSVHRHMPAVSVAVLSRPQLVPLPDAVAHPATGLTDNDYVIPRPKPLAQIRIVTRPRIASISLPLLTAATDFPSTPAPDSQPLVPAVQIDAPPHPISIVTQELDALDAPVNEYPAPVLKLNASHSLNEWNLADATKYCQDYAVQTVAQGANMPLAMDDGMKQRLTFFYLHCMTANANGTIYAYGDGWGASPAYIAVGAASADHPVNVSGSWIMSIPSSAQANMAGLIAMQTQPRSCSFTQSGNTISGTCTSRYDSGAVSGIIDGRQVRWVWKFPQGDGRHERELDFLGLVGPDGGMTGLSINLQFGSQLGAFAASPGIPPTQVASQR